MAHWLLKSEPATYSFADLQRDGHTGWTGVRNALARLHLAAMLPGDDVLFYHSVSEKAVVGRGRVVSAPHPDPTAPAGTPWLSVDVAATAALPQPVPLAAIRATPELAEIALLRQSRLSVMPLSADEFRTLLTLGGTH